MASESNVLHASGPFEYFGIEMLLKLKRLAKAHPMQRARLCLHREASDRTHEMLIVASRASYIRAHRHPLDKSESYHIVEGSMLLQLFGADGKPGDAIMLSRGRPGPFLCRMAGGLWHQPVVYSKWLIYHETYSGPFDKARDVEYAPWSPEETCASE